VLAHGVLVVDSFCAVLLLGHRQHVFAPVPHVVLHCTRSVSTHGAWGRANRWSVRAEREQDNQQEVDTAGESCSGVCFDFNGCVTARCPRVLLARGVRGVRCPRLFSWALAAAVLWLSAVDGVYCSRGAQTSGEWPTHPLELQQHKPVRWSLTRPCDSPFTRQANACDGVLICAALWTQAWKLKCVSEWTPDDVRQWLTFKNPEWAPHWEKLGKPNGESLATMERGDFMDEKVLDKVVGKQVFNAVTLLLRGRKDELDNQQYLDIMEIRGENPHRAHCDWSHCASFIAMVQCLLRVLLRTTLIDVEIFPAHPARRHSGGWWTGRCVSQPKPATAPPAVPTRSLPRWPPVTR
jgi:hypothetical protein